jgi:tripartite-type tricarboxylate transporter receptor subunit TctC
MRRAGLVLTFVVFAALALVPAAASAQAPYPNRVIRMIVPFPAGGATDVFARHYATRMSALLGQQIIVENKSGAAGAIGTLEAARAEPNGYTLLFGTASIFALYNAMSKNPKFDVLKDFTPVAEIGASPVTFDAHPSTPGDFRAIVAYAKANPGKLQYGSPGTGTFLHLAAERLKREMGGVDITHVPYRGGGPAMADLVAGQIPLAVDAVSTSLQHHRDGRARILALATAQRSALAPDIPTVDEALGTKGFVATLWNAVAVPAATPADVVEKLRQATNEVLSDRSFAEQMLKIGIETSPPRTLAATREFIVDERTRWKPVVEAAGVSSD